MSAHASQAFSTSTVSIRKIYPYLSITVLTLPLLTLTPPLHKSAECTKLLLCQMRGVLKCQREKCGKSPRNLQTLTHFGWVRPRALHKAYQWLVQSTHRTLQTWSSWDLSLGFETSRDPFLQVLVSVLVLNLGVLVLVLERSSLGLGLGLGTWDHGDSVFITHEEWNWDKIGNRTFNYNDIIRFITEAFGRIGRME